MGQFIGAALPAASTQLIQLSNGWQGSEISVSVFANQLPSPAKRQNRLLLITKKYYPLAGGLQQHEYPKQTDTVCLEAWCLVQLPYQIQAHRSSYSRSEEGGLSARCSVVIPTSSSFLDSRSDRKAVCKNDLLKKKLLSKKESYLSKLLQDQRNLIA